MGAGGTGFKSLGDLQHPSLSVTSNTTVVLDTVDNACDTHGVSRVEIRK